jgi:hypothetical protein
MGIANHLVRANDLGNDNLASLHELHSGTPLAERSVLVARDVFHFHLASLANMYAALSWTLVRLLTTDEMPAIAREFAAAEEEHGLCDFCNAC